MVHWVRTLGGEWGPMRKIMIVVPCYVLEWNMHEAVGDEPCLDEKVGEHKNGKSVLFLVCYVKQSFLCSFYPVAIVMHIKNH